MKKEWLAGLNSEVQLLNERLVTQSEWRERKRTGVSTQSYSFLCCLRTKVAIKVKSTLANGDNLARG